VFFAHFSESEDRKWSVGFTILFSDSIGYLGISLRISIKVQSWLGMITFIFLKTKFSIFALLIIFKLTKQKKLNKVVYKPMKIENKAKWFNKSKFVSNFWFI
jgi:hypothetical protein